MFACQNTCISNHLQPLKWMYPFQRLPLRTLSKTKFLYCGFYGSVWQLWSIHGDSHHSSSVHLCAASQQNADAPCWLWTLSPSHWPECYLRTLFHEHFFDVFATDPIRWLIILKSILRLTGNPCNILRTGVLCSDLFVVVRSRAECFRMSRSCLMLLWGSPVRRPLRSSRRPAIKAWRSFSCSAWRTQAFNLDQVLVISSYGCNQLQLWRVFFFISNFGIVRGFQKQIIIEFSVNAR